MHLCGTVGEIVKCLMQCITVGLCRVQNAICIWVLLLKSVLAEKLHPSTNKRNYRPDLSRMTHSLPTDGNKGQSRDEFRPNTILFRSSLQWSDFFWNQIENDFELVRVGIGNDLGQISTKIYITIFSSELFHIIIFKKIQNR
jgi:hypothetical protein